uniref:Uncharacterized protein n=1 Tax=Amphimedon queenslandica TaxID=400682 RepID=A0A1X7V0R7_AMPQE
MSDELKEFFHQHGIVLSPHSPLHEKLVVEYGVEKVSDISLLTEQELRQAGLNKIQSRKLLCDSKPTTLQSAAPGTTLQSAVPGLTESLKLDYKSSRPFSPLLKTARFKINYVLCIEMFVVNQEEHSLALEPERDTMDFLIKQICSIHNLPDVLTLELYQKNGTPLNVNEYTLSFTLEKWKIKNDDSFYVLPRRREQPSWILPEPLNDIGIDPMQGQNTLKILSEVFGHFSIQVNFPNLTVEVILQKASRVINVPSRYLKIYSSLGNMVAMKDEDLSQIVDGQELILRLGEIYSARIEFGKSSYIPVTEQTEKGLAKFYSILKYLTIGSDITRSSIVAIVFKLTGCVPLVAALHTFLIYHSFSHLSQIAILFEGFYHLSKALLKYFCNVTIEKTFEFLDYIFGLIIKLSKTTSSNDHLSFKVIRLRCPITAHKIIEPVMVLKNESSYEKGAALAKLERNEALPECSVSVDEGNLIPDDHMQHLLIAFSFSKILDIQVCETVSEDKMRISPLIAPCTWKEFKKSLTYLKIVPPNSSSSKRVTYTSEGYLTVFIEISKSSELGRIFYDPITGKNNTYTEQQLEVFATKLAIN